MPAAFRFQVFRQAPADLVEDQTDEGLGSGDVRWRHDQIERCWMGSFDEITDAPIASPRNPRHNRIAIKSKERHRCRQDSRALIVALVKEFAGRAGDNRVHTPWTEM